MAWHGMKSYVSFGLALEKGNWKCSEWQSWDYVPDDSVSLAVCPSLLSSLVRACCPFLSVANCCCYSNFDRVVNLEEADLEILWDVRFLLSSGRLFHSCFCMPVVFQPLSQQGELTLWLQREQDLFCGHSFLRYWLDLSGWLVLKAGGEHLQLAEFRRKFCFV